jgi:hypothetical protein
MLWLNVIKLFIYVITTLSSKLDHLCVMYLLTTLSGKLERLCVIYLLTTLRVRLLCLCLQGIYRLELYLDLRPEPTRANL